MPTLLLSLVPFLPILLVLSFGLSEPPGGPPP